MVTSNNGKKILMKVGGDGRRALRPICEPRLAAEINSRELEEGRQSGKQQIGV